MKKLFSYLVGIFGLVFTFIFIFGGFNQVNDSSLNQLVDNQPPGTSTKAFESAQSKLYFGDLHIHTSYSSDAYIMGVRTLPDDAYKFAKGETIEHGAGYKIRISEPLDFAAITDHSEYLGMMAVADQDVPLLYRDLKDILQNDNKLMITHAYLQTTLRIAQHYFRPDKENEEASKAAWQDLKNIADKHNKANEFTTFIAYEWSSQPNGDNLHRNVIYRGNANEVPDKPFSSLDSEDPEQLLLELEKQNQSGIPVFAIPHNGNLSNGRMYGKVDFNGEPMSEKYAELRRTLEPINEILQVKGASEAHPILSNLDEFANFEIFESNMSAFGEVAPPKNSYARDALRTGMEMYHEEGFNPYKFGVIGSSDGHNSSSPIEEDNFHGKLPMMDGAASLRMNEALLLPDNQNRATSWGSGGLAAIWAKENTREALFDAMLRKETYATSGPRISLRFFAAWGFPKNFLEKENKIELAYNVGVPMGSDLLENANAQAPTFYLAAKKDPDGANLDRLQVVKLWIDEQGRSHEKVFNVAASDQRKIIKNKIKAITNTVNVSEANYENSVGDEALEVLWSDPEFNRQLDASYYARAIEIPTPRWSTYDAKTLGIDAIEPTSIQERAISSAIWYSREP